MTPPTFLLLLDQARARKNPFATGGENRSLDGWTEEESMGGAGRRGMVNTMSVQYLPCTGHTCGRKWAYLAEPEKTDEYQLLLVCEVFYKNMYYGSKKKHIL